MQTSACLDIPEEQRLLYVSKAVRKFSGGRRLVRMCLRSNAEQVPL